MAQHAYADGCNGVSSHKTTSKTNHISTPYHKILLRSQPGGVQHIWLIMFIHIDGCEVSHHKTSSKTTTVPHHIIRYAFAPNREHIWLIIYMDVRCRIARLVTRQPQFHTISQHTPSLPTGRCPKTCAAIPEHRHVGPALRSILHTIAA